MKNLINLIGKKLLIINLPIEYEPVKKIRLENAQSNGIIIKGA